MSRLVAIDTNVLVWGIRRDGTAEQVRRARLLFQEFEDNKDQIIVPAIALAEYIRPYPSHEQRAEHIAECDKRFQIAPFDVKCASFAARLFNKGRDLRADQAGSEGFRNRLNADSMIIATAAAQGAQYIYSGNKDFRDLAEVIQTWRVLDLPERYDLFDELDS